MKLSSIWDSKHLHKKSAWADIIFVHPFSLPLSKFLAKYNVNPNYITILTVPVCLIAAILFATGHLWQGAFVYWFNYILDGTDGELARRLNRQSSFGSKLDSRTDTLNHFMMYFGLWYSQFYLLGEWIAGFILILMHYFTTVFGIIFIRDTNYKTFSPKVFSYFSSFEEGFFTFLVGPMFGIVRITLVCSVIIQMITHLVLYRLRGKPISFKEFKTRVKRSIFRVIE